MQLEDVEKDLVTRVTEGGYCIGCGACAHLSPALSMQTNHYGQLIPVKTDMTVSANVENKIAQVCPFSSEGPNEDELAHEQFPTLPKNDRIGHFDKIYAGRVLQGEFYQKASSGGVGKWLLTQLLESNEVDYVIQVAEQPSQNHHGMSYFYRIFDKAEEVVTGSKSAYYPIELSTVLEFILNNEGRYAITGVPCYVKTIRRLGRQDDVIRDRIKYTVGVVCGHLKSKAYAEIIGWQLGVQPDQLATVDFREKLPGKKANQKGVNATRLDGSKSESEIVQNLFGTNYGHGLFKYSACDFCDDVLAEIADVAIGDAWLPQYMEGGTSLIITRNKRITEIINAAAGQSLELDELNDKDAANSQGAGLKHRREYLRYRLLLKQKEGVWVPAKRVQPGEKHLTSNQKRIIVLRTQIAERSHSLFVRAKKLNDLEHVKQHLMPLMQEMHDLRLSGMAFLMVRALRKLKLYDILVKFKKKL